MASLLLMPVFHCAMARLFRWSNHGRTEQLLIFNKLFEFSNLFQHLQLSPLHLITKNDQAYLEKTEYF